MSRCAILLKAIFNQINFNRSDSDRLHVKYIGFISSIGSHKIFVFSIDTIFTIVSRNVRKDMCIRQGQTFQKYFDKAILKV